MLSSKLNTRRLIIILSLLSLLLSSRCSIVTSFSFFKLPPSFSSSRGRGTCSHYQKLLHKIIISDSTASSTSSTSTTVLQYSSSNNNYSSDNSSGGDGSGGRQKKSYNKQQQLRQGEVAGVSVSPLGYLVILQSLLNNNYSNSNGGDNNNVGNSDNNINEAMEVAFPIQLTSSGVTTTTTNNNHSNTNQNINSNLKLPSLFQENIDQNSVSTPEALTFLQLLSPLNELSSYHETLNYLLLFIDLLLLLFLFLWLASYSIERQVLVNNTPHHFALLYP